MRHEFTPRLLQPDNVIRRAESLGAKLIRTDDGWTLDGMPYTMGQLGYPNLCVNGMPGRVDSLSLQTADHYLRLCESRIHQNKRPSRRFNETFLG